MRLEVNVALGTQSIHEISRCRDVCDSALPSFYYGSPGSGKSTLAREFENLGFHVMIC